MDYMHYFAYPTIFVTIFMMFITFIVICGIGRSFKYLYFITYKRYPKLIRDVENKTSTYYEYDHSLKKYVRNDTAVYDENDPKIYKIDIFEHHMSF